MRNRRPNAWSTLKHPRKGQSPTNLGLHASLVVGDATIMASDVPGGRYQPKRSAYLALSVDSSTEAERIFNALSHGGEVFIPMQETFFAHRFAQFRDKFGVNWMILHDRSMH
jgi:PhnB protein